ncbi:MAG: hypothetical protein HZC38_20825 [Chloroflexi bacterium]|nr:hypothetical protein [Chloroflexota bacterium]
MFSRHRFLLIIAFIDTVLLILLAHVDIRQLLTNPTALIIGGIIVGLHILGGSLTVLFAFVAKKRWLR